jgi:hypothetical protein
MSARLARITDVTISQGAVLKALDEAEWEVRHHHFRAAGAALGDALGVLSHGDALARS